MYTAYTMRQAQTNVRVSARRVPHPQIDRVHSEQEFRIQQEHCAHDQTALHHIRRSRVGG